MEIIKFFQENYTKLQPSDYFLVAVFVLLTSAGIFLFINTIYRMRFSAQRDALKVKDDAIGTLNTLIKLKDKSIQEHSRSLNFHASEKRVIEDKLKDAIGELDLLKKKHREVHAERAASELASQEKARRSLIFQIALYQLMIVSISYRYLSATRSLLPLYAYANPRRFVREAPSYIELSNRLREIDKKYYAPAFSQLFEWLQITKKQETIPDLPKSLLDFDAKKADVEIDPIWKVMDDILTLFVKRIETGVPDIQTESASAPDTTSDTKS